MHDHTTSQTAYAGKFSIRDTATGRLIHGGGVLAPRPRLYATAEDATAAARDYTHADCEPVRLVAAND